MRFWSFAARVGFAMCVCWEFLVVLKCEVRALVVEVVALSFLASLIPVLTFLVS